MRAEQITGRQTCNIFPERETFRRGDMIAVALLTALWLVSIGIIGVEGDVPLNDDWAYARATQHFLETGDYKRSSWTFTLIVTNIAVGAIASSLMGFSFEILRASSLILGWIGILAAYVLGRSLGVAILSSGILAAAVALNPVYLNLSYTFMTDVPFAAITVASLALFVRGIVSRSITATFAGILLALAAILSRQVGVVIFAVGGVLILIHFSYRRKLRVGALAFVVAGLIFALVAYIVSMDAVGIAFIFKHNLQNPYLAYNLLRNGLTAFVYLGLFLLPVSILAVRRDWKVGRRILIGATVVVFPALLALYGLGLKMPLGINIVQEYGLGPQELTSLDDKPIPVHPDFWMGLTVVGLWGGCLASGILSFGLWRMRSKILGRPELMLLILFVVLYTVPLLSRSIFFDRYLLPVIPPLGVLIFALSSNENHFPFGAYVISAGFLLLLGIWSVSGTRDYLEHHRARHELLTPLLEKGIAPSRIDGGFEFTGWFNSDQVPSMSPSYGVRRWLEDREYILTYMKNINGYKEISTISYQRWFTRHVETLRLHHRDGRSVPGSGESNLKH